MPEFHTYLSNEMRQDLTIVAEAMKIEREPGVTNAEGKANISGVLQRLIIRRREEFKETPSSIAGKSMWDLAQERVSSKVK